MTHFAAVLRAAMEELQLTQEELAERMKGVSQSSLSRFLVGDGLPKTANLDEICRQFPPRIRESLAAAYLSDQIPASAADLVAITSVREAEENKNHYSVGRAPAGSILRRDLDALERRALKDPNLAKVINYLASMAEGTAPNADYFEPELAAWKVEEDPLVIAARQKLSRAPNGEQD